MPRFAGYLPGEGAVDLDRLAAAFKPGKAAIPIIFYRAMLLAADTAPIDALCAALTDAGLAPAPLFVTELERPGCGGDFCVTPLRGFIPPSLSPRRRLPRAATPTKPTPLDEPGVPVLQVVSATTRRAAWQDSPRGLGAADLAMHVVLPELDGRVLGRRDRFQGSVAAA